MVGHGGSNSGSKTPFIVGSATSGVLEILLFHPIDTIAKRLMSNTELIFDKNDPANNMNRLNTVLFKKSANANPISKWLSLFPGVSFGAAYKVLQRTYKFGSQPILRNYMKRNYGVSFNSLFGNSSRDMLNACSGALVGMGEVVLLPLDVLKIKSQTNPEVLKGRGFIDLIIKENFRLYRGIGWTMARNCPGSFALFGANSLVYTKIFNVSGPREAKTWQIVIGSLCGGVSSIVVSSPLDVIKTRIQNKPFDDNRSGFKVIKDLLKEEGPHAFFKGLTPKIGLIGPKLVFSFTVAQALIARLQDIWEQNGWNNIDNNDTNTNK